MKKSICTLTLALALCLGLCACGGNSFAGGTWTPVEDKEFVLEEYTAAADIQEVPKDWKLPADVTIGDSTRTEVKNDLLLWGEIVDSNLNGFKVARYEGAETLTPVYEFKDGVTVGWQPFFSPDGTKLAFPWQTDPASTDWKLRVVDLETGKDGDLDLPEWDGGRDLLLASWQDDSTLQVTLTSTKIDSENVPGTWTYALPG